MKTESDGVGRFWMAVHSLGVPWFCWCHIVVHCIALLYCYYCYISLLCC